MNATNNRPTVTVADEDQLTNDAPPGLLRTATGIAFADPDIAAADLEIIAPGDTPTDVANALTVTVTAEPANVVENMGYNSGTNVVAFEIKDEADLCALAPRPDRPFKTTVTVTATDSDGASVSKEIVATTAYACGPELATASVDGLTLTLLYDEALKEDSEPAPGDFSVTAAGNALSVTGVDVSGSTIVLTLAEPANERETVTVSYTPHAMRPIQRTDGTGDPAESFMHRAVTNNSETPRVPVRVGGRTGADADLRPGAGRGVRARSGALRGDGVGRPADGHGRRRERQHGGADPGAWGRRETTRSR